MTFRAVLLNEEDRKVSADVVELDDDRLPDGDVTVDIDYSTLNYKDGMILGGIGRLVRDYPHVPGIDFSGTVADSSHAGFSTGDRVVLTGWRVGEIHWGGYATKARVSGEWLVKLPDGLTNLDAMTIGTAGFTSMLAVQALEDHGIGEGPVLVTGAAGGVGSVAIHLLARAGLAVAASTGRPETADYLTSLGATEIVDRNTLVEPAGRPLLGERWGGCVDAVGGSTLAHVLAEMSYGSSVTACGLAGGNDLDTTVIPFLLRGVNLLGIDSVMCPLEPRQRAWERLAQLIDGEVLSSMATVVGLETVIGLGPEILAGQVQGRTVVDVNA